MRLAVLGFNHESNTFAPVPADLASSGILEGQALRQQYAGTQSTLGGFLAVEDAADDIEIVPLGHAWLTPSGPLTAADFEHLSRHLIDLLRAGGPWDGVLVECHGAAVAAGTPDADGAFLRRVRRTVGAKTPVGVTVDMHANISDAMIAEADVVTAYQTNPHVDAADQALTCARLIVATVRGHLRPVMALTRVPVAINILSQGTSDEPMAGLLTLAREQEVRPGVLSVNLVEGFPYADVAEMGMSVVAVTDGDNPLARDVADRVAEAVWAARHEMLGSALSPERALQLAVDSAEGPVVLCDVGDNVWAGSPGDSTHLLHTARQLGVRGVGATVCDPGVAAQAVSAGVGGRVQAVVGGKTDDLHGAPFPIDGDVIATSAGTFEDTGVTHAGKRFFDLGPTAGIQTDDGFLLVVHSLPISTVSRQQFRIAGIEPERLPILVVKGVHSPRAAFEPIASRMLWLNTRGCTSADLSTLAYRHRSRPMFPFERDAERAAVR